MTETKIFDLLLENNSDFPQLQQIEEISEKFTDIIYDSLKFKSTSATTKRINVLKFIQKLTNNCGNHIRIDENNCDLVTEAIPKFSEFQVENVSLQQEVLEFYSRKSVRHKEKIRKLQLLQKFDQESSSFPCKMPKFSYYETSETLICRLVPEQSSEKLENVNFREKQTMYAYALVNFGKWKNLGNLLDKLANYDSLYEFEKNFLFSISELNNFDIGKFQFIFETAIIQISTEILQLNTDNDVRDYFKNLENNRHFQKIRILTRKKIILCMKLQNLITQLYCFSFCNQNLLNLRNLLEK